MSEIFDFGLGGFDVSFDVPDLSTSEYVRVDVSAAFTLDDADLAAPYGKVELWKYADFYALEVQSNAGSAVEYYPCEGVTGMGRVRFVGHNNFISVYLDRAWMHTFALDYVYYPEGLTIKMAGNVTVTNILARELYDWSETIFVDVEMNAANAINSVVGRRPVEIWSTHGGTLNYSYHPDRGTATPVYMHYYERSKNENDEASADAIVLFDDTAVMTDASFLEDYGFVTKLYRFPDFGNSAIRAARKMQNSARRNMRRGRSQFRFDPRIELSDIVVIDQSLTDGGTLSESHIVERVSVTIADGAQSMSVEGRSATG